MREHHRGQRAPLRRGSEWHGRGLRVRSGASCTAVARRRRPVGLCANVRQQNNLKGAAPVDNFAADRPGCRRRAGALRWSGPLSTTAPPALNRRALIGRAGLGLPRPVSFAIAGMPLSDCPVSCPRRHTLPLSNAGALRSASLVPRVYSHACRCCAGPWRHSFVVARRGLSHPSGAYSRAQCRVRK